VAPRRQRAETLGARIRRLRLDQDRPVERPDSNSGIAA
jgi:hypothetical protein